MPFIYRTNLPSPTGRGARRSVEQDRRNVEQEPRLRGCDRGADHKRVIADPLHVCGVRSPEGPPLPPCDAPRLRDATVKARISTQLSGAWHPAAGDGGAWSRDRCNVEQGPRFAGMRPWNRSPRVAHRFYARLRGQIPAGAPLPPCDAPTCGDATVEPAMSASPPSLCTSSRSDPQRGPSSALRRAHPSASRWNPVPLSAGVGVREVSVNDLLKAR